jgi:hypothetical protein
LKGRPRALWKCRAVDAGGKLSSRVRGSPSSTSSFPPSPTALGNRQRRDFHIPTAPTVFLPLYRIQTARTLRALAQNQDERRFHPAKRRLRSGSSRIGMKPRFQAHLALESKLDFRLISGLENAWGACLWVRDIFADPHETGRLDEDPFDSPPDRRAETITMGVNFSRRLGAML